MTPSLFSVSYAGLWGQHALDVHGFLRKAASLGYPAVQLMGKRPHLSVLDGDDGKLEAIERTIGELGLEVATVAAYTDFTAGKEAAEVPFVEMQVAYIRSLAKIARKLGARIVRVMTGYTTDPEGYDSDWHKCVKAVRESAAVAADYGIILGLQNHHDTGIAHETYAEFLDDVGHPNCKAMFDPWSPALHGDDLYQCAKAMAPRMVQTTLADYVKLRRFAYMARLINYRQLPDMVRAVPLGEGFVDLEAFFAGLKEGGFDGYVGYEMCSPLRGGGTEESLDATASKSLAKIKGLIA